MEGSVQKSGNRVLINVQLIDAATGEHIWAQVYTRSLADVFAVESDVATQVAAALKAELVPSEAARITRAPTRNPQAYLLFLKANYYANQVIGSNSTLDFSDAANHAAALYRQAIDLDPSYALAWARLSYVKSYGAWRWITHSDKDKAVAESAAKRALALAPNLPQAHLAMGYVDYYGRSDFAAALAQFQQARKSLPNDANMIGAIAFIHRRQGKWNDALAELRESQRLDPRNGHWYQEAGFVYMMLRQYNRAIHQYDLALALAPHNYDAGTFKAMTLLLAGKPMHLVAKTLAAIPHDNAGQTLSIALEAKAALLSHRPEAALKALAGAPEWISGCMAIGFEPTSLLRARALALKGEADQARLAFRKAVNRLRDKLHEQPKQSSLWAFLGLAEAGLGNKDAAIDAASKAVRLTPLSKDAVYGPSYLTSLAQIYAQTNRPGQAIKLLHQLLAMPAGFFISTPIIERDPIWDPLRQNPGFQQLFEQYQSPSTPPVESTVD